MITPSLLVPFINYGSNVVMQFTRKNAQEVIIKARSKFLGRAVDVSEMTSKRILNGQVNFNHIRIDSEEYS